MLSYFKTARTEITAYLKDFLAERGNALAVANQWGKDACDRLYTFTAGGKMIRGGLIMLLHDLYGGTNKNGAIAAAAAMELFQSSFLIHDDIMDRDTTRRGEVSLFYQYRNLGVQMGFDETAYHFGESMGICLGDLSTFLGYESLAQTGCGGSEACRVLGLFSRELSLVGLGQMQDVYFSHDRLKADEHSIVNLYRFKTARYTFSLPMMAGALLGGAASATLEMLGLLGEKLGIVFQIKDDELGLYGNEAELGKPIGSDLKEGKMTLAMHTLLELSDNAAKNYILSLLGNPAVTAEDVARVRDLMREKGVLARMMALEEKLSAETREMLEKLPSQNAAAYKALTELVDYNITRTK